MGLRLVVGSSLYEVLFWAALDLELLLECFVG